MTRRKFLLSVSLMSILTWLGGSSCLARMCGFQKDEMTIVELKRCLLGLYRDLDSPYVVGKRYLALYPQEKPGVLLLAARIQSSQPRTSNALKKMLTQQREYDFQNGEIVIIDGWLLSRTEVEVCALTVIL